jgi:hypothetical protein
LKTSIDTCDYILRTVHEKSPKSNSTIHGTKTEEEEESQPLANASGNKLVCSELRRSAAKALHRPSPAACML